MPIQLDKILADIAEEKVLHPNYSVGSKKDVDDAWARVGKNNKLSVHETRSIFKVLQKKYEQEKSKEKSTWKLFGIMEQIHRKMDPKQDIKEEEIDLPIEEGEEYEMLEVQEDEDEQSGLAHPAPHSTGSASESDSPGKSTKSNSSAGSPEKEIPLIKTITNVTKSTTLSIMPSSTNSATSTVSSSDEKKLMNANASTSTRPSISVTSQTSSAATAAALHKKGITLKKNTPSTIASAIGSRIVTTATNTQLKNQAARAGGRILEVGKTIQLPESLKRKLSDDHQSATEIKKISIGHLVNQSPAAAAKSISPQVAHTTTTQLMQLKHDQEDQMAQSSGSQHGINVITIPGHSSRSDLANGLVGGGGPSSSAAATVASTSTNGFSPRIEEIDFRNDIIFDAGNGVNGSASNNKSDVINLGNFDHSLPPTFFKNLCNSSRHEALGLYVANVMNRLRPTSAAKLELGILRAIIEVQHDDLEQ